MQANNIAITRKPIAVNRCAIAIAVPLTESSYHSDLREPKEKKDFARFGEPFARYQKNIIIPVTQTIKILEASGVSIFTETSLFDFSRLFDGRFDVIILFTHSCKQKIEFFDGLVSAENIVKQIPSEFSGFIDLSICHPLELVNKLDQSLPNSVCHYINATVSPVLWMQYFTFLFKHLIDDPTLTYLKASVMAHNTLRIMLS